MRSSVNSNSKSADPIRSTWSNTIEFCDLLSSSALPTLSAQTTQSFMGATPSSAPFAANSK